ncbi:MAG TPA: ABATE domain-containing protein, partial [Kribbella sp.]|nr:ABATE domain-containing protein [Kribbella sp.]
MTQAVPGQRDPAPGPLRLVQDFLNTTWLRTGEDDLADPAALQRWLTNQNLLDNSTRRQNTRSESAPGQSLSTASAGQSARAEIAVTPADFAHAIDLRRALQTLIAATPSEAATKSRSEASAATNSGAGASARSGAGAAAKSGAIGPKPPSPQHGKRPQ